MASTSRIAGTSSTPRRKRRSGTALSEHIVDLRAAAAVLLGSLAVTGCGEGSAGREGAEPASSRALAVVAAAFADSNEWCSVHTSDTFMSQQWPEPSRASCRASLQNEAPKLVGRDFTTALTSDEDDTVVVRVSWLTSANDDVLLELVRRDSAWLINGITSA